MRMNAGTRRGLTLVELMVVVAIVGTLMALLLPAVQSARENSRRSTCANNLKQLGIAAQAHVTLLNHFPTGGWSNGWIGNPDRGADWRQPGGWCFTILPFLQETNLQNLAGTSPSGMVATNVPGFVCPTRRSTGVIPIRAGVASPSGDGVNISLGPWMHADYAGNRGSWASVPTTPATSDTVTRATSFGPVNNPIPPNTYPSTATASLFTLVAATLNTAQAMPLVSGSVPTGGVIFAGSSTPPAMIRDGFSTTYLFAEKYVPQTDYATGTVDGNGDSQCAYVGDSPDTLRGGHRPPERDATAFASGLEGAFGGPHVGVFNAVMCDGSVRQIGFDINAQTHFLLAARADRQQAQLTD